MNFTHVHARTHNVYKHIRSNQRHLFCKPRAGGAIFLLFEAKMLDHMVVSKARYCNLKPSANERQKQETRNTKQNRLEHPRFIVCVTPKQKTMFRETLFRESNSV